MSLILNMESATTVCSVALSDKGRVLAVRELNDGYTHAENLHVFIEAVLKEQGVSARELAAVAVSKGPGSYTGLRIGVSAAKGLCYALGLPLIGVDTLQAMAFRAREKFPEVPYFCPMIDARRMEVYCAVFDRSLRMVKPTEALVVDEQSKGLFNAYPGLCVFGDGMAKCKTLLRDVPGVSFAEDLHPSAESLCALSYERFRAQHFEDTAYFEPYYLKDFLILKKQVKD